MDMGLGVIVKSVAGLGTARSRSIRSMAVSAMSTVAKEVHGDERYAGHDPEPILSKPAHRWSPVLHAERR